MQGSATSRPLPGSAEIELTQLRQNSINTSADDGYSLFVARVGVDIVTGGSGNSVDTYCGGADNDTYIRQDDGAADIIITGAGDALVPGGGDGDRLAVAVLLLRRDWLPMVTVFTTGAMLHMAMDTIAAPLRWLAPFSDVVTEFVQIPKIHSNWIVSFVFHWTF